MISLNISDVNNLTALELQILRIIAGGTVQVVGAGLGDLRISASSTDSFCGSLSTGYVAPGTLNGQNIEIGADGIVRQVSKDPANRRVVGESLAPGGVPLDPADNPAAGAPDDFDKAVEVFAGGAILTSESGEPDPAQIFSGGAQLSEVAQPPKPQSAPDPTLTTPPSPPPNLQTSPPPSGDATNGSPPPPPPPAPGLAAASDVAGTMNAVQVDTDKLPWDARIHASTKTTNADGRWKKKRGVEADVLVAVEAQLRAAMSIPTPAGAPPPPPSGASVPPPPGAAPAANPFGQLMEYVTQRIANNLLTKEQVTAACKAVGLESLNLVMSRPDLAPAIIDELRKVAP